MKKLTQEQFVEHFRSLLMKFVEKHGLMIKKNRYGFIMNHFRLTVRNAEIPVRLISATVRLILRVDLSLILKIKLFMWILPMAK